MLAALKTTLKRIPLAYSAYASVRSLHDRREGARLFENCDDYVRALYRKGDDGLVLRTREGLQIAIRQNLWDARIVREIFFEQPYTRHLKLPPQPVVVDIGGYIGDFTLYAVKFLGAARVVVYEPALENFAMLRRNVELNGYGDRVVAVRRAVGAPGEVTLNVQKLGGDEIHVSAYRYAETAERRRVPSVSLAQLIEAHGLDTVDLLKVDCDGGEYDIFPAAPDEVLARVRNLAMEIHALEEWQAKLERLTRRLRSAGYTLHRDRNILSGWRE